MRKRRNEVRKRGKESGVFLTSDKEVTVYGCEKVEKYSPDEVMLRLTDGRLAVKGRNMTLKVCYGSEIRLAGKMEELKLADRDEENRGC